MSSIYNNSYQETLSVVNSYNHYVKEMLKVEDELCWSRATYKDMRKAYEYYLIDYPSGIYRIEATRKVDEFITIEKEKELERKRLEQERLSEITRKREEARLAEIERKKEKEKLAEIARKKEEARLAEIARKKEEARLAEIARRKEELRLAEIAQKKEEVRLAEIAQRNEEARLAEIVQKIKEAILNYIYLKGKEDTSYMIQLIIMIVSVLWILMVLVGYIGSNSPSFWNLVMLWSGFGLFSFIVFLTFSISLKYLEINPKFIIKNTYIDEEIYYRYDKFDIYNDKFIQEKTIMKEKFLFKTIETNKILIENINMRNQINEIYKYQIKTILLIMLHLPIFIIFYNIFS